MSIITIKQRTTQSGIARKCFKELTELASKITIEPEEELWKKVPSLKPENFIDLDNLRINTGIQRDPFSSARLKILKKAMKEFDARQFGRVIVAKKQHLGKDVYTVVEGQGRVLLALAMGLTRVPYEEVLVKSSEDEATLFVKQSDLTHTVTKWDKHHAILECPNNHLHKQALDIDAFINSLHSAEYEPQKLDGADVDVSGCYAAIKAMILRENRDNDKAAGERDIEKSTGVFQCLVDIFGNDDETLAMRADVLYPCMEYVLSYQRNGLSRLEEKISDWRSTRLENGYSATLDDFAIAIDLPRQKNANDKIQCYKNIKRL